MPKLHFVCHLLVEYPELTQIPRAVAKLPVFDEFLPISSKLDHLCSFSRRPGLIVVKRRLEGSDGGPFVSQLLAEDQEKPIPSALAILPFFYVYLPIPSNSTIYTDIAVIQHTQFQN